MADGVQPVGESTIAFASTINGVKQEDLNKFQKLLFSYQRIDNTELFSLINLDGWDLDGSGNINTKEEFEALKKAVDDVVEREENERIAAEQRAIAKENEEFGKLPQSMQNAVREELRTDYYGNVICKGVYLKDGNEVVLQNHNFNDLRKGDFKDPNKECLSAYNCSPLELAAAIAKGSIDPEALESWGRYWDSDKGQILRVLNDFAVENDLGGQMYIQEDAWSSDEVIFLKYKGNINNFERERPSYYTNGITWKEVKPLQDYKDCDSNDIGGRIDSASEYEAMRDFARFILKKIKDKKDEFPNHAR